MKRLAVVGAGSWGTALAIALASRFPDIRLWVREPARAAEISRYRENSRYLPGFQLPSSVSVSSEIGDVVNAVDVVLAVVPSAHMRAVLESMCPHVRRETRLISAAKGIEEDSLCRMSEVMRKVMTGSSSAPVTVLSGPTFAKEIAAGEPAALVIASEDITVATDMQQALSTIALRFYTSTDVTGVEIGAALKNVIAIGAGLCQGLGLGSNSIAALVTRGLAEITRLAVAMGGNPRTLSGLAGLGDLVLTATGDLSRNRSVGRRLGEGHKLDRILAGMTMIAEGVGTCRAGYRLGRQYNVDLPIVNKMYEILYEGKAPREAIRELMERPLTSE